MMNKSYARAYTEVLEILKFLPINDYCKIPKQKIEYYTKNKDYNYQYEYNLENPSFSKETAAIIINLYKNHIASKQVKQKIDNMLDLNLKQMEEAKREIYNPDNVFKNKKKNTNIKTEEEKVVALMEYKDSIFIKIKNWFKHIFNKTK